MFSFISFRWLLNFIFKVSKYSAYLFISIAFKAPAKFKILDQFHNKVWFAISLIWSICATFLSGYVPVAEFTRSPIMEFGVNFLSYITSLSTIALKISNMVNGHLFLELLNNFNRCHLKVSFLLFRLSNLKFNTLIARGEQNPIDVETRIAGYIIDHLRSIYGIRHDFHCNGVFAAPS